MKSSSSSSPVFEKKYSLSTQLVEAMHASEPAVSDLTTPHSGGLSSWVSPVDTGNAVQIQES